MKQPNVKNGRKRFLIPAVILIILLMAAAALLLIMSKQRSVPKTYQRFSSSIHGTFDTEITLIGFAGSREEYDSVFAGLKDIFQKYDRLFDAYHDYDGLVNLSTLNRLAGIAPVKVSDELFGFISWCLNTSKRFPDSPVNIAMGSVLSIWHEYREQGMTYPQDASLPPLADLQAAALHTSLGDVILNKDEHTVFFADPLLRLDFGAVAKGYTAQIAADYLAKSSMPSFILNAGGNVCAGASPKDGRKVWGVGIQDPDGAITGQDLFDVLYLAEKAVVTSGDYQRYYTVDGVRYSHLISPETLMPGDRFRAVTVVADDSALCDFLSTHLFLCNFEDGKALVDQLDGVEAYWIFPDRTVRMTDGMKQYANSAGAVSR